ncbi:MAG TPA: DNA-binding protein [Gammaproteobacteria bacterium]|nr:DNA-binding protein [Gammaproteobacteria bacterium]
MQLQTIKQFCHDNPAFVEGGVRWQIFNEKQNGLSESGAVVRMGRKILIFPKKYLKWAVSGKTV